jgi:hypothetical protein
LEALHLDIRNWVASDSLRRRRPPKPGRSICSRDFNFIACLVRFGLAGPTRIAFFPFEFEAMSRRAQWHRPWSARSAQIRNLVHTSTFSADGASYVLNIEEAILLLACNRRLT